MTRTITTAADLDALPVGSVVVEGDHTTPDEGSFLGITTIPGVFHRFPDGWYVVAGYGERAPEEILPATVLHDPSDPAPAPSVVSDAAGLGDRIAALSARLAAVGFPACTCHPGDDDSERCLPSPQDWRAEIERAALSSTTLTATPSATRDEVARLVDPSGWRYFDTGMFPPDHPASTGVVHNSRETADALLARFNITPKEDR